MYFSTIIAASAVIGAALAQTNVHVVRVASTSGQLQYFPNSVTAAVGDMVQFQCAAGNHTVTQSTFDQPCEPIHQNNAAVEGFFSGFQPVTAGGAQAPTFTILVNNTTPIWVYCSQGQHCQKGMNLVINENTKANASRSLSAYTALAAKASANLPGSTIDGGSVGSAPSNSTSSSGSSGSSGSAGSTGSPTSSGSSSQTSSPSTPNANAGSVLAPSAALGGVLAMFMALLM